MTEDAVQLREFVENGDEEAFRELVDRHFRLVYGTALRQTNGDVSMAEDIAQVVFTDFARKAKLLPSEVVLVGWLYQATRFTAAKAVRSEQRRKLREQEAFSMQDMTTSEASTEWQQIQPLLDAAMDTLNENERNALLLYYFEQKSFRVVGAALGISDDAAQKRVSRALDKLRDILAQSGATVAGSTLSTLLGTTAMPSPPTGLTAAVAKSSLAKAVALGPPTVLDTLAQNFASAKAKVALGAVLTLLLGVGFLRPFPGAARREFVTVNLSTHYNGGLDTSWTPAYGNNYLAALGSGRRVLKGVPFEVHGVVQLQGAEWKRRGYQYPEQILGIRVGVVGRRIHILHANSAFNDLQGTAVAGLTLHYVDGQQAVFTIQQGVHLLDWWQYDHAPIKWTTDSNTVVAWTGSNPPAEHNGAHLQLFDTTFINPQPENEILSIDYTSAMAGSAPFMVAVTIER